MAHVLRRNGGDNFSALAKLPFAISIFTKKIVDIFNRNFH